MNAGTLERRRLTEIELLRGPEHEPDLGEALSRAAHAGQELALDQLELLRLEVGEKVSHELSRLVRSGVGLLAIGLGWALLLAAAGVGLFELIGLGWTLVVIGGPHLIAGLVLLGSARS